MKEDDKKGLAKGFDELETSLSLLKKRAPEVGTIEFNELLLIDNGKVAVSPCQSYIGYVYYVVPIISNIAVGGIDRLAIPVRFQNKKYKTLSVTDGKGSFYDSPSNQGNIHPSSHLFFGKENIDLRLKRYKTSIDDFLKSLE